MNNFLPILVLTFHFLQTIKCDFSSSEEHRDLSLESLKGEEDLRNEVNAGKTKEQKEGVNEEQPVDPDESYNMMMSIIKRMFQKLNDQKQISGGWKDDKRQLSIPQFHSRQ